MPDQTDDDLNKELVNDLPDGGVKKVEDEKGDTANAEGKAEPDGPAGDEGDGDGDQSAGSDGADTISGDAGTESKAGEGVQAPKPGGTPERAGDTVGGGADGKVAGDDQRSSEGDALRARPNPLAAELDSLTKQIEADDFDPYTKDGKKAMIRRQDLSAQVAANQAATNATAWDDLSEQYDQPKPVLKKIWSRIKADADKRFGSNTEASQAAAVVKFEAEAEALKRPVKPGGKSAPTPLTRSGGRVVPPSAGAVPPQPKQQSDEDELVENVSRATTKVLGKR